MPENHDRFLSPGSGYLGRPCENAVAVQIAHLGAKSTTVKRNSHQLPGNRHTQDAHSSALLSEAGFEKVFRTQNWDWVRRSKLFCR